MHSGDFDAAGAVLITIRAAAASTTLFLTWNSLAFRVVSRDSHDNDLLNGLDIVREQPFLTFPAIDAATVKPENNQAIGHPPNPYGDSNHFTAQQFATSAGQAIGAGRNGVQQQGIPAPAPPALPHGYSGAPGVEQDAHIHPELRNLREANGNGNHVPTPSMMQPGLQPQQEAVQPIMSGPPQPSSSLSPNMDDTEMGEGSMSDGRRQAKRELSQSKRAAQNRAAQVSTHISAFVRLMSLKFHLAIKHV